MVARRAQTNGPGARLLPAPTDDFDLTAGPAGFRTLPYNIELEQALLGAILIENQAWHPVARLLRPEHFYEPVHARIFAAMTRLIGTGNLADHLTLKAEFDQDPDLRELNGAKYLAGLVRAAETVLNVPDYARAIHELAIRRGLIRMGEHITNQAYDLGVTKLSRDLLGEAHEAVRGLQREASDGTDELLAADLDIVAEGQFSTQEWAIEQMCPLGTAGLIGGAQSAGKTFLELIRMVCMVTGQPFLGRKVRQVKAAMGFFSEDSKGWLEVYLGKICRGLGVDPRALKGRIFVVSTFGTHRTLFQADRDATQVSPTPWLDEIREEAIARQVGWLAFDHLLRYCAINYISTNQCFSLFGQLDALSSQIAGNAVVLTHPSKGDIKSGVKGLIQVGGSGALVYAPRWVQSLKRLDDDEDGRKVRKFGIEKISYADPFAIRLVENRHGIVEPDGEMAIDDLTGAKSIKHRSGRPSQADRTFEALVELYTTHRRAIAPDELVTACIRFGVVAEASPATEAWRNRRKVIARHLDQHRLVIDFRDDGSLAVKPEGLNGHA